MDDGTSTLKFKLMPPVFEYACPSCYTKTMDRHISLGGLNDKRCVKVSNWFVRENNSNVRIVLPTWMKPS